MFSAFNSAGQMHPRASIGMKVSSTNVAGDLVFNTRNDSNYAERMRITSSGNLLVGTTGTYYGSSSFFKDGGAGVPVITLLKNSPLGSTDPAFYVVNGHNGGTISLQILASGNVQNLNNSYGAISDIKLKENIEPSTPKLEKLMQVEVVNYNMIGDDLKQIGVTAQQLEQVFPSLVSESDDFEKVQVPQFDENNEPVLDEEGNPTFIEESQPTGTKTKSVKYSIFVPILIKAMQEQQVIIEELKTRIQTLEGNNND
jgi:hypothetical protein